MNMQTFLRSILTAALLVVGAFESVAALKIPDPLVGHWFWRNGVDVVNIQADGNCYADSAFE